VSWRRCVNHPVRSHSVCPACGKGYCEACASGQTVQNAVICPSCDGLCLRSSQYEESLSRGEQQARSLMQELGTIVAYPLRDPMGLVMLAAFTWFFGLLSRMALFGAVIGIALSQGVLLSYCFFAVSRVASGNLHDFMPDLSDPTDLIRPLRLGLAVLIITSGPMLALTLLVPAVALYRAEGPASARAAVGGALVLFGLALLWKIVYTPVALTVAALSRGFFKTLNPVVGLDTIRRMGGIYWQALLIYSLLAGAQWLLGAALALIPVAGGIVRSFVDAYAYLAIGCTLGLAVFKKARELGWD
jgi:hypothetical protein